MRALRSLLVSLLLFPVAVRVVHAEESVDETMEQISPCFFGYQRNDGATQDEVHGGNDAPAGHENADDQGQRFNYIYNLTALIRTAGMQDFTVTQSGFHYEINFCANTLTNTDCWFFTPAWMSMLGGSCNSFGSINDMTFRPLDAVDPEQGIILSYNNPTTSCTLDLVVSCDPSETASEGARITGVEPYSPSKGACLSTVFLSSPWACPESFGEETISLGSVLLIILACVIFLYLAGGVAYQMAVKKEPCGLGIIPNREFWKALPGLVVDGVKFIVAKIQGCRGGAAAGGGGSDYSQL